MQTTNIASSVEDFISRIVHIGSAYDLDGMNELYAADHSIIVLNGDGTVTSISRSEMLHAFRARRDAGEPALSTEYRVLHVEPQDDGAVAILYRRMSSQSQPVMYEIRLRKNGNSWLVNGETVTPWPDPDTLAGPFLPPLRTSADETAHSVLAG